MIIQGFEYEFDEASHTYIIDGVIVPSVTQIMNIRFGDKYKFINEVMLDNAAKRGTKVHTDIEAYCQMGIESDSEELKGFKNLIRLHDITVVDNEVPILIVKDGKPIVAGRLDLVMEINEKLSLADIKTTSTLDRLYLQYQLNLYRIGYIQCYGKDIEKLYGMHLRKDKRNLVEIPINEKMAWDLIKKYEEENVDE